jgi:hypothetical protein
MVKWSTLKLVAIKPHKYGTRHLTAGEEYEAPSDEAVAHVALRKADFARPAKKGSPAKVEEKAAAVEQAEPEPHVVEQTADEHTDRMIDRLRLEATQLGINVDGRWGIARLQHEIAQAKR